LIRRDADLTARVSQEQAVVELNPVYLCVLKRIRDPRVVCDDAVLKQMEVVVRVYPWSAADSKAFDDAPADTVDEEVRERVVFGCEPGACARDALNADGERLRRERDDLKVADDPVLDAAQQQQRRVIVAAPDQPGRAAFSCQP